MKLYIKYHGQRVVAFSSFFPVSPFPTQSQLPMFRLRFPYAYLDVVLPHIVWALVWLTWHFSTGIFLSLLQVISTTQISSTPRIGLPSCHPYIPGRYIPATMSLLSTWRLGECWEEKHSTMGAVCIHGPGYNLPQNSHRGPTYKNTTTEGPSLAREYSPARYPLALNFRTRQMSIYNY